MIRPKCYIWVRVLAGVIALLAATAVACNKAIPIVSFQDGDLIFQTDESSTFCEAIVNSTFRGNDTKFTHVGIYVMEKGEPMVIEASSRDGVVMTPLNKFMNQCKAVSVMRVNAPISLTDAVKRAKALIGREYDWEFNIDNDKLYCSELVQSCFLFDDGTPIFESVPMNFTDSDGNMPEFWVELFSSLGREIPQDEPGTNPNSLYHSSHLVPVQ